MAPDPTPDPGPAPAEPSAWPFRVWVAVALAAGGWLLTDLVVGGGAGELVIDWKVGPAFVALLGGVWGARRARRTLAAARAEDDRLAEAEGRELLREVARHRERRLAHPRDGESPAPEGDVHTAREP